MITEAEARVAADELAWEFGLEIEGRLIDGDRDPLQGWLCLYNAPEGFPAGWWFGRAHVGDGRALRSSEVIGVRKETGEVRHLGSANDEG